MYNAYSAYILYLLIPTYHPYPLIAIRRAHMLSST